MSSRPIHKNLDTSFVNLSALIKYLRRRQFIGNVDIQLNGYQASVRLKKDNKLEVNEHDQISGRISVGNEALQRVLIRSREPGGTINVYQFISESEQKPALNTQTAAKNNHVLKPVSPPVATNGTPAPKAPEITENGKTAPIQNGNTAKPLNGDNATLKIIPEIVEVKEVYASEKVEKSVTSLPDFPFALSNEVEAKARHARFSDDDWQKLLKVMVELLAVIDRSLAMATLDFNAAFTKVRTEISSDYPFLSPDSETFDYAGGKIKMTEQISAYTFVGGIVEALKRILDKLSLSPKFKEVHKQTLRRLQIIMKKREPIYTHLSITQQLKRLLGA